MTDTESNSSQQAGTDSVVVSARASDAGALFDCVLRRDLPGAKQAIADGHDINALDKKSWTPLRCAVRSGQLNMVLLLLKSKADLNVDGQLSVVTAASWGHVDTLEALLVKGKADISSESTWEISPLVVAAREGRLKVVKCLVKHGVDVNSLDESGNDPLLVAWKCNHPEIVFYLVESGAVLKDVQSWGLLADHAAAAYEISKGLAAAHDTRIRHLEMTDQLTSADFKPTVSIPHQTVCTWLEKVPSALLVLLDQLLSKTPRDVPVRSNLGVGVRIRSQYVKSVEEWKVNEEPLLLQVCPKDDGKGKAVIVKVLHQAGILKTNFFFSLVHGSFFLVSSNAIQCCMFHVWCNICRSRFMVDLCYHLITLICLFLWSLTIHDHKIPAFSLAGLSTLTLLTVADILEFGRQYVYYHHVLHRSDQYFKNLFNGAGFSLFNFARITISCVAIVQSCISTVWEEHADDRYHASLALAQFMQWIALLDYIKAIEGIGPALIPTLSAGKTIGYFMVPFMLAFVGMIHADVALGAYIIESIEYFFGLIILQIFPDPEHKEVLLFERAITGLTYAYSLLLAFIMYNVIYPVLTESYDFQRERRMSSFLRERSIQCFRYGVMSDSAWLAPVDSFMRLILRNFFQRFPKSGILWTCELVDKKRTYSARLAFIGHMTQSMINKQHNKTQENIHDTDFKMSQLLEKTALDIDSMQKRFNRFASGSANRISTWSGKFDEDDLEGIEEEFDSEDSVTASEHEEGKEEENETESGQE